MLPLSPKKRLIFALDVPTLKEAAAYARLLKDHAGVFKIGLELFTAAGPKAVSAIKKAAPSAGIFLDLKFHDIPATVKGAVNSAASLGADFLTVHIDEGFDAGMAMEASNRGLKVLAVTVLTSLSKDALIGTKYANITELVLHRARLARVSGCAGVVCSGAEVKAVKDEFGPGFLVITPGIRSSSDALGDQKRAVTAYEAVYYGADYIVVGRPIRNAPDPVKAAKGIAEEIRKALKDRGPLL